MRDPLFTMPIGAKVYEKKSENEKVVEQITEAALLSRADPLLTLPAMKPATIAPVQNAASEDVKTKKTKKEEVVRSPFLEEIQDRKKKN